MVERTSVSNNATGVNSAGGKSNILLTSSTITGNNTGLAFSGGAVLLSYKTNNIGGNLADGAPSGFLTQN
jgi:hypothetical protein